MLKENQTAPDFSLPSTSGKTFSLSETFKGQPAIIYFYPKDNTRVCTKEACDFRDHFEQLKTLNVNIVGISTDPIKKHLAFQKKHQLPFELLSDRNGKVSKLYQAHIPFLNLSKRITYLLDREHKIIAAESDLFNAGKHLKQMISHLELTKR